jgi:multisubunit Na+/H+ antiporter MnhB subunit
MSGSLLMFDVVLGLTLVTLAAGVLLVRELFQAIVLFIVLGLLLAVAWCRLEAVDVALAEAAIGAGLTGALLLNTWAATQGSAISSGGAGKRPGIVMPVGFTIFVACGLAAVILPMAVMADAPRIALEGALPDSGVSNPVTAVLLNFRAYDTLLEVVVLLSAVLAVIPLTVIAAGQRTAAPAGPVLAAFIRLIVPLTALVAVYVLWTGTKAPGGAFQAAALLCAAGVLLLISSTSSPTWTLRRWRYVMTAGPALFLLVGLAAMIGGGSFLEYRGVWATVWIISIETALTGSLAVILIRLFSSTSPSENGSSGAVETSTESDR